MRVLYKLWRPTWSQHIKWSVLQRSPDFWCSPRVLKLCPIPTNMEPWLFMLCMRQMVHNSRHQHEHHLPTKTINTLPRTLANTVNQCCWGFLWARTPCQCQWDCGTIVFMHEMPLSGSQALTAQLVELLEQSLQRIGRVPPAQNLVLCIVSWKVMWSSQENTLSQVTRTQYKV